MAKLTEIFASNVFSESIMRERLPKETFTDLMQTIQNGDELEYSTAMTVAACMKEWAVEKGATHYCHWFQPMTGVTAEKHNSFISPIQGGKAILEFSGKELIRGESDASSFPSGGLRATFEARGYTAWDPTSSAFVLNKTLYIPTAFCSYSGVALDKKTPLLRSMSALNKQAMRVLRLLGNKTSRQVISTLGIEQEYFIVDRELYNRRPDLLYTGRTLFGAPPPKGQEMDYHYYGHIKPRIAKFMQQVDTELWKLGVCAKTRHNEAAPAQHELACLYDTCNIATDHNQLVMEILKQVAEEHGLICLLHEKPFAGVNGSGKHNNWSVSTDDGINLLKPGKTVEENTRFLLFLLAVIKAVDEYSELLRMSVATYSNDLRLGGNEAPPAVISIFLGEQLSTLLDSIAEGAPVEASDTSWLALGVASIPKLKTDNTDRNRTSPFAFTGNKFEFRMPGSSLAMADPNIILNTAVAESLSEFADFLEASQDPDLALNELLRNTIIEHRRIIFNGNNYSPQWRDEAIKRGLLILDSAVDAIRYYTEPKSIALFTKHQVLDCTELRSRSDIAYENYIKAARVEAETMLEMIHRQIVPAAIKYQDLVLSVIEKKKNLEIGPIPESSIIREISLLLNGLQVLSRKLEKNISDIPVEGNENLARYWLGTVLPIMNELRSTADRLEHITEDNLWPFPTYGDLLFKI
ncbi:MAG: glutamine synthetase type III [Clostridiales bacterium]|nr:glutamine synthetase type III [Clostridiales bacterium]